MRMRWARNESAGRGLQVVTGGQTSAEQGSRHDRKSRRTRHEDGKHVAMDRLVKSEQEGTTGAGCRIERGSAGIHERQHP